MTPLRYRDSFTLFQFIGKSETFTAALQQSNFLTAAEMINPFIT
jgi:hypothetical protein